jgi:hypothetical protein
VVVVPALFLDGLLQIGWPGAACLLYGLVGV